MQLSEKPPLPFTIWAMKVAEEVVMEGEEEAGAGLAPMLALCKEPMVGPLTASEIEISREFHVSSPS